MQCECAACLQGRAKRGELHYLPSAQAYFDDVAHFREMTSLCSYTHPRVWQDNPGGCWSPCRYGAAQGCDCVCVCLAAELRSGTCRLHLKQPDRALFELKACSERLLSGAGFQQHSGARVRALTNVLPAIVHSGWRSLPTCTPWASLARQGQRRARACLLGRACLPPCATCARVQVHTWRCTRAV